MAKSRSLYYCRECGYESPKWMGQCPGCKEWNTFSEEPAAKKTPSSGRGPAVPVQEPKSLSEVNTDEDERMLTGIQELDRVLGGGMVVGSLVLVGGDAGIGK